MASKRNVASSPQLMNHAPQDGNVNILNSNGELPTHEGSSSIVKALPYQNIKPLANHTSRGPLNRMPTQSKDFQTMAYQIDDSSNAGRNWLQPA